MPEHGNDGRVNTSGRIHQAAVMRYFLGCFHRNPVTEKSQWSLERKNGVVTPTENLGFEWQS